MLGCVSVKPVLRLKEMGWQEKQIVFNRMSAKPARYVPFYMLGTLAVLAPWFAALLTELGF
jgi:hypothetical protein